MTQARGGASQVLIDFETVYGADPETPAGISVPFNYPFDLKTSQSLKEANTHRGIPDAAQPFYGNLDVKGSPTVPIDQIGIGYWLKALLGAPSTGGPSSDTLDNAAAVDKVGDLVGIPITGHAFVAGQTVTIDGTDNYDGTFVIASKTTNEIVIPSLYVAETFAGTETCVGEDYTHIFKRLASIPSMVVESGFTDITKYFKFNGVKINKFSLDIDPDNELVAKLDLMGANETPGTSAYDADPTAITFNRFQARQVTLKEGGSSIAYIQSVSFEISNNLDGNSFVIGGGGIRGFLPEGDCMVSGKIKALFQDLTLYNKAVNGTESSLEIILTSGLHSLTFLFPELLFERQSPYIVKGGVYVELPFQAYYENNADTAVLKATLVNAQASYA